MRKVKSGDLPRAFTCLFILFERHDRPGNDLLITGKVGDRFRIRQFDPDRLQHRVNAYFSFSRLKRPRNVMDVAIDNLPGFSCTEEAIPFSKPVIKRAWH